MILASEGAFTWWGSIGNRIEALSFLADTKPHIIGAWLVCGVLCVLAIVVGGRYRNIEKSILPDGKLSVSNFTELIAKGFVFDLAKTAIGHNYKKYIWLIGPLFFYILIGNLFGLLPGFLPPTSNMNTNLAMGLVVFFAYQVAGFMENGAGYLKHFWAPAGLPVVMAVPIGLLLMLIELISHAARPFSLSLRLFGNIDGDHRVLETFSGMVPIGVPIAFLAFGLLVAFIQAFVFTLLTAVYIGVATAHDH